MCVFRCRCVSCAVMLGTKLNMLPEDGPMRPKHVAVINFNVLISVKKFKV